MRNQGFLAPQIDETHYILGGGLLPVNIIQPDGNWTPFLPEGERQLGVFGDTFNCTGFSTLNGIEILMKQKFGISKNFSDRALGISAGTWPPGNDPHTVCEAVRKTGLVEESSLPLDNSIDTVAKYYSPKPLTKELIEEASKFLKEFGFGHEWVFSDPKLAIDKKQALMMTAIKTSPLGASVHAWKQVNGLYVKDRGEPDNHFITVINFKEGEWWEIFDNIDNYVKRLSWDYDFGYVKRYTLEKLETEQKVNIILQALQKLFQLLGFIQAHPDAKPTDVVPEPPQAPPQPQPEAPKPEEPKYKWSTKAEARHSVRVICDEYYLTWVEKDLICAVIEAESNFNIQAVNKNSNGTVDYGICQINSHWWVGPGKLFASAEEVLTHPEESVRFMVESQQQGHLDRWSAFKNNSYKKFL